MKGVRLLNLPGWANSGAGHWQTLWEKSNPSLDRVHQKNWREPKKTEWVAALDAKVSSLTDDYELVLICHSLGCWLAAHWAIENFQVAKRRVKFALLVAPPHLGRPTENELWPGLSSWLPFPDRPLPFPSVLVFSTNDPYCCVQEAEKMGLLMGSEMRSIGNKGHINAESLLGEWEEGKSMMNARNIFIK